MLADYTAEGGDELSLQSGEMLIHMNRDPSGWTQVKKLEGAESGWVPSSYLREVGIGCAAYTYLLPAPVMLP